jgi:uncharacterized protein YecA (UPF0149 family)
MDELNSDQKGVVSFMTDKFSQLLGETLRRVEGDLPCGSDDKYKKCCGNPSKNDAGKV